MIFVIQDLAVFVNLNAANRAVGTAVELTDQVAAFTGQFVEIVRIFEKFPVLAMVTVAVVVIDGLLQLSCWDVQLFS